MGFQEFKENILSDQDFAAKVKGLKSLEEAVAFGKANGYDFTAEEITAGGKLTDDELDAVAGGAATGTNGADSVDLSLLGNQVGTKWREGGEIPVFNPNPL